MDPSKLLTFSSCLFINLGVSAAVRVGGVRLRKKRAFQHLLILLRKWQHALLELHRDPLGSGQGLCRQLVWIMVAMQSGLKSSFGAGVELEQVVELQT